MVKVPKEGVAGRKGRREVSCVFKLADDNIKKGSAKYQNLQMVYISGMGSPKRNSAAAARRGSWRSFRMMFRIDPIDSVRLCYLLLWIFKIYDRLTIVDD